VLVLWLLPWKPPLQLIQPGLPVLRKNTSDQRLISLVFNLSLRRCNKYTIKIQKNR
jgi:hypothetical protein